MKSTFRIFVKKPNWDISLQRSRHRQEDNNDMVLGEIFCEGVNWIHLIENRFQ
jgi:hypothetical protein